MYISHISAAFQLWNCLADPACKVSATSHQSPSPPGQPHCLVIATVEKPKDPEEEVSHLLEGQSGSYELVSQVIEVQGSGGGTASGQTASCDRHQIVPEPSQAALLACIQQRSRAPSSCSSSFHARMHTNNRM